MRLFLGTFVTMYDYLGIKKDFSFLEGKWVEKRNLHLTYHFIGEVATPLPIIKQLSTLAYEPQTIPIKALGFFGSPPKILYAKASSEQLYAIAKQIHQLLAIEDPKPFIPHITLCRIKRVKNFEKFIKKIRAYEHKRLGVMELKVALIQSHLTPKGPVYKTIHTFTNTKKCREAP